MTVFVSPLSNSAKLHYSGIQGLKVLPLSFTMESLTLSEVCVCYDVDLYVEEWIVIMSCTRWGCFMGLG